MKNIFVFKVVNNTVSSIQSFAKKSMAKNGKQNMLSFYKQCLFSYDGLSNSMSKCICLLSHNYPICTTPLIQPRSFFKKKIDLIKIHKQGQYLAPVNSAVGTLDLGKLLGSFSWSFCYVNVLQARYVRLFNLTIFTMNTRDMTK